MSKTRSGYVFSVLVCGACRIFALWTITGQANSASAAVGDSAVGSVGYQMPLDEQDRRGGARRRIPVTSTLHSPRCHEGGDGRHAEIS